MKLKQHCTPFIWISSHIVNIAVFRYVNYINDLHFVASCIESHWEKYYGYAAVGATQYAGPRTIRQCMDYCEQISNCVGVDIDVNVVPLRCWPHLNRADLRPANVYQQQNTTHYRLISRCLTAANTSTAIIDHHERQYIIQS